jgi:hypothetical protein
VTLSPLTITPVSGGVARPAHAVPVVGPPCPDVVDDHVVTVDLEADSGFARSSATDAEEHVLNQRGVIRVALLAGQVRLPPISTRALAHLEKDRRVDEASVLTIFLSTSGSGGILNVINGTGGSSTIANPDTPVTVVSYP